MLDPKREIWEAYCKRHNVSERDKRMVERAVEESQDYFRALEEYRRTLETQMSQAVMDSANTAATSAAHLINTIISME